jgi:hypothetical protein
MNAYVAEALRIVPYLAGPFALVFVLAAGLSVIVNKLSRERVLNPWLWGGLAMVGLAVCVVVYHFVMLYRLRGAA